jgi:hypothetical protein
MSNLSPKQKTELRSFTNAGQLMCIGGAAINALVLAFNISSPVCWTLTGICWWAEAEMYRLFQNMQTTASQDMSGKTAMQLRHELSQGTFLVNHVLNLFPDERFVSK